MIARRFKVEYTFNKLRPMKNTVPIIDSMVKEKLDGFYVYSLLKLTQEMTDVGEIKIPRRKKVRL